jgi:chemotaxis protein CheC
MTTELNPLRQDALREIGNIGLGSAVTALSGLTGVRFNLEVPQVLGMDLAQLPMLGASPERLVVGTIARVSGDCEGEASFLFPWESAQVLWGVLVGSAPTSLSELNELYESVIREVANIMLGSFLNALSQMTQMELKMDPPAFAADMFAALVGSIVVEAIYGQSELLAIETQFHIPDQPFQGFFFYLPEGGSLHKLFETLGI